MKIDICYLWRMAELKALYVTASKALLDIDLFHFAPQQHLDCNTAQLGHNILKFPSQT